MAKKRYHVTCIDLFCGVGGLTHGFQNKGIDVVAGIDIDARCRYPYTYNNSAYFIEKDIRLITGKYLDSLYNQGQIRLLAGCAPCQPFSTYSNVKSKNKPYQQWELILDFARLIKESKPELITMENVPRLLNHKVFQRFLNELDDYFLYFNIIECTKYCIPQTRKRLVLIGSRLGEIKFKPPILDQESYRTVKSTIFGLPIINAGETDANDPLHTASSLSPLNLLRIRASKPGGSWRDWEPSLIAECHRKKTGQTYPSVYGRMEWDLPSPTITTQCFGYGNGRFGHPEQDRAISLREAAMLQTFPKNYQFLQPGEKAIFDKMGRLIGNAVPVKLGEVIADSFLEHLSLLT
jgi:DNA (cytosine-5)-methyltransferase 1